MKDKFTSIEINCNPKNDPLFYIKPDGEVSNSEYKISIGTTDFDLVKKLKDVYLDYIKKEDDLPNPLNFLQSIGRANREESLKPKINIFSADDAGVIKFLMPKDREQLNSRVICSMDVAMGKIVVKTDNIFVGARQSGKTTWLLNKLIKDPEVVMVVANVGIKNQVTDRLLEMNLANFKKYVKNPELVHPINRIIPFYGVRWESIKNKTLHRYGLRQSSKIYIDNIDDFFNLYGTTDLNYEGFTTTRY